ncbi:hypothetical protein K458DRAFT_436102 [Lentithecium fluviatile CBS 122367]|uniref:Uncharacterized protein n=1 Tax=Lentithecium fluviatile CBS 122367 TaxID=1168545 RepID=A0A6G1IJN9_9PLEO|nr:hypothetical protein K458DRAFT_436102 [Lentithecium fluviatile CBS 122367]
MPLFKNISAPAPPDSILYTKPTDSHNKRCLCCFLSQHIQRLHDKYSPPAPKPSSTLSEEEKTAFKKAQKKKDEEYWALRHKIRRWALLMAGTAIAALTVVYVVRFGGWVKRRERSIKKEFGDEQDKGAKWAVRKDSMLRFALMILFSSPCACFLGFLIATGYYWKDKRDRKAKRAQEKNAEDAQKAQGAAVNPFAPSNPDPDPKLIDMKYDDLQRLQKVEVVIGSTSIDAPAQARVKDQDGREQGWTASVASWWSGAIAVYWAGYDGRGIRKMNWEKDVELQETGEQAHGHFEEQELKVGLGIDLSGGGGGLGGGMSKRERPVTEWPS